MSDRSQVIIECATAAAEVVRDVDGQLTWAIGDWWFTLSSTASRGGLPVWTSQDDEVSEGLRNGEVLSVLDELCSRGCQWRAWDGGHYTYSPLVRWWFGPRDRGETPVLANTTVLVIGQDDYEQSRAVHIFEMPERWDNLTVTPGDWLLGSMREESS